MNDKVTNIADHKDDQIIASLNDAKIAVQAHKESLPKLGLDELRTYVEGKRWEEIGGVIFSITEKGKDKTDYALGRIAFSTLAKEIVLSHKSVYVTNLSNLIAAVDKAQIMDEDVWLDQYEHLFVTNFYSAGDANPLDPKQRQRIHDFIEARVSQGVYIHVQINGVRDVAKPDLSPWYGPSFWRWFKEQQVAFKF